jgi:hypothetical protein
VSNKSKFIDLDAKRPRLMNLETATKLLELHKISDVEEVLVKVMADPIAAYDKLPPSPYLKIVEQLQIVSCDNSITIQGIKMQDWQQALDYLIGRRNITDTDALRAIALAIDLERMQR